MPITIKGSEDARKLARRLSNMSVTPGMTKALRRTGPGLMDGARRRARATLPQKGGLADRVARSNMTAQSRSSGDTARLRVTATADMEIDAVDRGLFHHPVFGRNIVTQRVPPGWFTEAIAEAKADIRKELERELRNLILEAALSELTRRV